ncbi:hypothetical protein V8C26DRAFT_414506 [Trichoderma gracile]
MLLAVSQSRPGRFSASDQASFSLVMVPVYPLPGTAGLSAKQPRHLGPLPSMLRSLSAQALVLARVQVHTCLLESLALPTWARRHPLPVARVSRTWTWRQKGNKVEATLDSRAALPPPLGLRTASRATADARCRITGSVPAAGNEECGEQVGEAERRSNLLRARIRSSLMIPIHQVMERDGEMGTLFVRMANYTLRLLAGSGYRYKLVRCFSQTQRTNNILLPPLTPAIASCVCESKHKSQHA